MSNEELRNSTAEALEAAKDTVPHLSAFVGLDGFVDEIIHVVDKREDAENYVRVPTIAAFSRRLAGAAGKSTNIELVRQLTKLGGNGPIMANALASFSLKTAYLGALGYPSLHPVFEPFASIAEVHSVAENAQTDALEFNDGKLMLGKHTPLNDVTWENIVERFGLDPFYEKFSGSNLVAFVNWTMVTWMSEIWESLLKEFCPKMKSKGPKHYIFFDLADPEKRHNEDILHALNLMLKFGEYFNVVIGFNEKEAFSIARILGLQEQKRTPEGLAELARQLHPHLPAKSLMIHPVRFAVATGGRQVDLVRGPYIEKPKITTGAGDHFNAGFCLAKLLDFRDEQALMTGVASSGYYVRSGESPSVENLIAMMRNWPEDGR